MLVDLHCNHYSSLLPLSISQNKTKDNAQNNTEKLRTKPGIIPAKNRVNTL